jgi:hypothetical protein
MSRGKSEAQGVNVHSRPLEDDVIRGDRCRIRGGIVGYDADRMIFQFTMMDEARIVDCEVSSAALEDLASEKGVRPIERELQFRRLRDTIERVTSGGASIRIFSKHIRKLWCRPPRGARKDLNTAHRSMLVPKWLRASASSHITRTRRVPPGCVDSRARPLQVMLPNPLPL